MDFKDIYRNLGELDSDDARTFTELLEEPPRKDLKWSRVLSLLTQSLDRATDGYIIARDENNCLVMASRGSEPQRILLNHGSDNRHVSKRNVEKLQYFFIMLGIEID